MANPEHESWFEDGTEAWNKRRETTPFVPDFSGRSANIALFMGKNLTGVNLSGADFSESGRADINFSGANLSGANFNTCLLSGSRFDGADLSGADFTNAYLEGYSLGIGNRTPFSMAPASLSKAIITDTVWLRPVKWWGKRHPC